MTDTIAFICLFLLFALLGVMENLRRRTEIRLAALQEQVGAIASQLGIKPGANLPPEVLGLIRAGRKIEAIKAYREATGAGLAEAKEAVERLEAQVQASTGSVIAT